MPNCRLWKKGLIVGIIILFIGSNIVSGLNIQLKNTIYPLSSDNGNTLYVGGSGTGNYSKIQDAIDNSTNGDTIFVYDDLSPYFEHLIVYKSINLIGEDKNTTTIDGNGNGNGYVVTFTKNEITLYGFTIQNGGPYGSDYSGICVSSNYNIIDNNIILNSGYGIMISEMSNNIISNNTISKNGRGIMILKESNNNLVIKNNIINNDGGVCLQNLGGLNPSNNIISRNNIKDNPVFGIYTESQNRLIISINNIENSENGIFLATSQLAIVKYNNFINLKNDAFFVLCYGVHWSQNYWEKPMIFPKIIFGYNLIFTKFRLWVNYDFYPTQKPYDITKEIIKESNVK